MPPGMHYFPLAAPALLGLAILFVLLAGFVAARLLTFASESMGLAPYAMIGILLLSLLGSYINIPIAYLPEHHMTTHAIVSYFGMPYVVPVMRAAPTTILAVNVGGALIPTALSFYLILRNQIFGLAVAGNRGAEQFLHPMLTQMDLLRGGAWPAEVDRPLDEAGAGDLSQVATIRRMPRTQFRKYSSRFFAKSAVSGRKAPSRLGFIALR